jgi:hypothetical protein
LVNAARRSAVITALCHGSARHPSGAEFQTCITTGQGRHPQIPSIVAFCSHPSHGGFWHFSETLDQRTKVCLSEKFGRKRERARLPSLTPTRTLPSRQANASSKSVLSFALRPAWSKPRREGWMRRRDFVIGLPGNAAAALGPLSGCFSAKAHSPGALHEEASLESHRIAARARAELAGLPLSRESDLTKAREARS